MPKKIGIVEQIFYPQERGVRTKKFVLSLSQAGFSVVVICRNVPGQPKEEELSKSITVYRFGQDKKLGLKRMLSYPAPFNLLWSKWIYQAIRKKRLECLLVTNLRLFIPAWLAARFAHIPVIFDMAEYYPMMSHIRERASKIEYLLKHPAIVSQLERLAIRWANHIWVVAEEQKQRLVRLGVPVERISVVSNTPILFNRALDLSRKIVTLNEDFRLVYVGIITKGRGIDLILKALQIIKEQENTKPLTKFLIVGDGSYRQQLQRLAHELDIEDRVQFLGWKSPREIDILLKQSHVGVIPHVVSDFTQHTIPNKLFDYMLHGLPVLATPMNPVRRIIEAERCGLIVPEEPLAVAKTVLALKANPNFLEELGRRGQQAVFEKYNWEQDAKVLLQSLQGIVKGTRRQA